MLGGAHGAMVIIKGMNMAIGVQILNVAIFILHSTNTLEKDIHPIILPPAMVK